MTFGSGFIGERYSMYEDIQDYLWTENGTVPPKKT
jgi:hypothetical protein